MADITGVDYDAPTDFGMSLEEAGRKGGQASQKVQHERGNRIGFARLQQTDPGRLRKIAKHGGQESQRVQHSEGKPIGFQNKSPKEREEAGRKGGQSRAHSRDRGERSGDIEKEDNIIDSIVTAPSEYMPDA